MLRAEHTTDVDPSIRLPDMGILRRFTIDRDHPKGLAPPTDTSLRDYMARSERDAMGTGELGESGELQLCPLDSCRRKDDARADCLASDTNWITDLLSDYELDSLSFFPNDFFDLGSLPNTDPPMLNAALLSGGPSLGDMSHSEASLPDAA